MKQPEPICVSSVNWSKEGQTRDKKNEIISEANYLIYITWGWYIHLWIYMFTIKLIKSDSNSILVNFNMFKNSVLCFGNSKPQFMHQIECLTFLMSGISSYPMGACSPDDSVVSVVPPFPSLQQWWCHALKLYTFYLFFHKDEFTMEWIWYKYKAE